MIIIKLDYFSLLSPEPIKLENMGSIISPTLRQISKITYPVYYNYIGILLTDIKSYYEVIDKMGEIYFLNYTEEQKEKVLKIKEEYKCLSDEEKLDISFFNIFIFDDIFRDNVVNTLNFFIEDTVIFSKEYNMFFTYNHVCNDDFSKPTGFINQNNYSAIIDIILQRICIEKSETSENVKVKNKIAAKLLEKMKKANKNKQKKHDKKMDLPNLISSLSSHSKNLNMINIWDLTVYQLYDQFRRQQLDDSYAISSAHVAAWGDSENKFDNTIWFSLINED